MPSATAVKRRQLGLVSVTVELPPHVDALLAELARQTGHTKRAVIVDAIIALGAMSGRVEMVRELIADVYRVA